MRRQVSFVFCLILMKVGLAQATDLAFSRNARTFETQHSSLVLKGMAHACLAIANIPDTLPCNPALVPLNKKPKIDVELLLSNGYAALNNIQKLLDGKVTQDLVDTLFSEGQIIQIESNADINFQSKYLNAQYSPVTIKSFSVVRNEANPDLELYAVSENGFTFQTGYEIFENLYAGLQARIVNRKFIRQRFKLVELGTTDGKNKLKPQKQTATYLEPGVTYFFDHAWRPRVSLLLANSGSVSKKYDELSTPTEIQGGIGISPPISWGDLEISLDYRSMNYEEETDLELLHLGALYHFGSMYLMGGIDANGLSGGVFYSMDKINAGIMYSTTEVINEDDSFYTQTVYVQLGWQI